MIVVTGATGFLGRHVLSSLQKINFEFAPWSRPRIDFSNVQAMEKALRGVDQVLHLAGQMNGRVEDLKESNTLLTKRLVEASKEAGVRRIIFVSSAAAHLRKGPYGQSKWEAEEILKSSGIGYLIFRPALIYGPGDSKNVATMEKLVKRFPVLPLLGGGRFLIQPVYVDDVVSCLIAALQSAWVNQSYDLAGPSQISLKEMLETIAVSLGKSVRLIPVPLKPVQTLARVWSGVFPQTRLPVKQILELDQHSAFEIDAARKAFGFAPRTFKEGIAAMRSREALCVG